MPDLAAAKAALGYADWATAPLRGDASMRQFARLSHPAQGTAILMATPLAQLDSQRAFLRIADHLHKAQLCAPKVLAVDDAGGLLILEDLGDTDVARAIAEGANEDALYACTIDLLVRLSQLPVPSGLGALTPDTAVTMLDPYFDEVAQSISSAQREALGTALHDAFARLRGPLTLSLRDFHSENLIWRPAKTGLDRLGIVDFQDAFAAPAEYDLASLLWDARRDVAPDLRSRMLARFADATGRPQAEVAANAHLLALQRNLRILGIFARLARSEGKPGYLALMPRVTDHIRTTAQHPTLRDLAQHLPETATA